MTQDRALSILKSGGNVFLTGEPGSGKTHTINQYVAYLRDHDIEPAITASTGIAATHIGGMTIHSWSGIGIKKVLSEVDLDALSSNERLSKRALKTQILIIDEISMLDAQTLSAIDSSLKALRRNEEPFGGMQVIFVGDFFQLPPITRYGESQSQFAFRSPAWDAAAPLVCYITEQHRQEDGQFLSFLSAIRSGELHEDHEELLSSRMHDGKLAGVHTRLYSHNANVDHLNNEKLQALSGDIHEYEMESRGSDGLVMQLKKGCLSPEILQLKIGAHIMCTKNSFEQGFANGTLGVVTSFSASGNPIIKTKGGKIIEVLPAEWNIMDGSRTLATISQIPLRLAWAITVHKSQGMTLDAAVVDLSQAFEYGQGYVALSRVRTLDGLFLLGYNRRALEVHPEIVSIDQSLRETSEKAEIAFEHIEGKELEVMYRNFILACGGTEDVQSLEKKAKKKISRKKVPGMTTYDKTLELLHEGKTLNDIAEERVITFGTVISHVEELFMKGKISFKDIKNLIPKKLMKEIPAIHKLFVSLDTEKLTPVFEKVKGKYSFDDLKLARLYMYAEKNIKNI